MCTAADGSATGDYVANLLGIPAGYELEAILSLGVPESHREPNRLTDELRAKVHHEKF